MSTKAKWEEHHHTDHAAHLGKEATHHRAMAALPGKSKEEVALHKSHAEHCEAEQARHLEKAEDCRKAVESDFSKLAPLNGVSGVTPNRVLAVPRPGQQPIAKANVPTEFSHLFSTQDEREAS
jgi:hypothetical protein